MIRNSLTFPKNSFLAELSEASWQKLSAAWRASRVPTGTELIKFGDTEGDVFFVLDGKVRAIVYTPAGREVSFLTFSRGDCIGEFTAIDESTRSSDAVTETESHIARLSSAKFRELVRSDPELSFVLMKILVGHLRRISQRVVDFNAKSADERLRDILLSLAQREARGDEALIERPPTQAQLAAVIFSSRESVAREMGRLRRAGVIARKKRALHVTSVKALEEYAAKRSTA